MSEGGCFHGVGVGPGDPELITLKAHRLIQKADLLTYLINREGRSRSREIAALTCAGSRAGQRELPIEIVMSRDRTASNRGYDQAARKILQELAGGLSVVFLCEGDPLFFGSFAYLLARIGERFRCEVVPGISSLHAASAAIRKPLAMLDESLAIVSGRSSDRQILDALNNTVNVVVLKAGQERPRLLNLLQQAGRYSQATYLESIGCDKQLIIRDLNALPPEPGPYFSMIVVNPGTRDG